jgi:hypothetical protein
MSNSENIAICTLGGLNAFRPCNWVFYAPLTLRTETSQQIRARNALCNFWCLDPKLAVSWSVGRRSRGAGERKSYCEDQFDPGWRRLREKVLA